MTSGLNSDNSRFGKYELRQFVAEGGMAEIYLAEQTGTAEFSKLVAIKRMLPQLCREPQFVAMFLDEARIASRLSHPNVVQVFDFGEIDGRYYLAMEYLAGESLSSLMRHTYGEDVKLDLSVALQIMIGVCDGLHHAHEYSQDGKPMNLVHRDVSPSNVVVTYQGGIKVLDFGIARAAERKQERTQTGVIKGKFPYCSPEQFKALELDRRSDIFSMGVVFHELVTGKRLFKRDSDAQTCMAVMTENPAPPTSLREGLPPELDRVLARALEKDRDKRYSTALELRRDLERLVSGPTLRIDEYMLRIFGQARQSESINPVSSFTRTPTVLSTGQQSYREPLSGEAATAVARPGYGAAAGLSAAAPPPPPPDLTGAGPVSTGQAAAPPAESPRHWRLGYAVAGVLTLACLIVAGLLVTQRQAPPVALPPLPSVPVPAPVAARATLQLDTLPRGAVIEIGGIKAPGVSPVRVEGLAPGQSVVSAVLAGYRPHSQVVELVAGDVKSVVLTLAPLPASLEVAAPPGAHLAVDGAKLGEARSAELEPGRHRVEVELVGFQTFLTEVDLASGEKRRLEATLVASKKREPGLLDIACAPWCRVLLDGRDVGQPAPFVGLKVPSGKHQLRMEHPPTGSSREVEIFIKPGATVRETASFRQ